MEELVRDIQLRSKVLQSMLFINGNVLVDKTQKERISKIEK